jgi:hypothetical protein
MGRKISLSNAETRLLFLLILTDFIFIGLHLLSAHTGFINNDLYLINEDNGYAEVFQYVKEFWVILLLGYVALKERAWLFGLWSFFYFYILVDDALKIHERIGGDFIGKKLGDFSLFGLKTDSYHFGQAVFGVGVALVLFIMAVFLYRSSSDSVKKNGMYLFFLFVALGVSAVGFDFLSHAVPLFDNPTGMAVFTVLEDGGEHIVISLILWLSFSLNFDLKDY